MTKKKSLLIKVSDKLLDSGLVMAKSSSVWFIGEPKLPAKLKRSKDKKK